MEKQSFMLYWELWKINIVANVLKFYHAVQDRMKKTDLYLVKDGNA